MMNATQRPLSVSAYIAHDGRAIFVPNNVTTTGLGIAGAEVITLDRPSEEELGAAALRAIGTAGRVVPHPPDQDAFRTEKKRFLKSVGFRSHKALMRECPLQHPRHPRRGCRHSNSQPWHQWRLRGSARGRSPSRRQPGRHRRGDCVDCRAVSSYSSA